MLVDRLTPSQLRGSVQVSVAGLTYEARNLVLYSGADILARLLAGETGKISHVYIEYENTAGAVSPVPAGRGVTAVDLQSMTPPRDFLRAPLAATPLKYSTDVGSYAGNGVTFHAVTTATQGALHGALTPFSAGSNSVVMAVSLVAATRGVIAGDLLYARHVLSTPLPVTGLGQVSVTWNTEVL